MKKKKIVLLYTLYNHYNYYTHSTILKDFTKNLVYGGEALIHSSMLSLYSGRNSCINIITELSPAF